jgi:hypothetical protein
MKFFPVALVQKSVPEIRGIFVVGSNLKPPITITITITITVHPCHTLN